MAIFNEILVGRYNRALQRIFGIKGPPPVRQVAGEITPAITMFYGAENRFMEGWFRYGFGQNQVAVPGLTTAFRIRNPETSGALIVMESIKVWFATADDLVVRQRDVLADGNLAVSGGEFSFERRISGPNRQRKSVLQDSQDLAGSQTGTLIFQFPMQAGGAMQELITTENQEWVLDPGQWFQFHNVIANVRWVINLIWRERPIEESETK